MSYSKEPVSVGDVVRISEIRIDEYRRMYPDLTKDDAFEVVHIDKGGRHVLYCEKKGRAEWVPVWKSHAKIVKRCGDAKPSKVRQQLAG